MSGFSVTYAIITPESAEQGDCAETGIVCENVSLREAYEECGRYLIEDCGSWFSNPTYGHETCEYFEEGTQEERNLHPPQNITPSSYARLRKLFDVR